RLCPGAVLLRAAGGLGGISYEKGEGGKGQRFHTAWSRRHPRPLRLPKLRVSGALRPAQSLCLALRDPKAGCCFAAACCGYGRGLLRGSAPFENGFSLCGPVSLGTGPGADLGRAHKLSGNPGLAPAGFVVWPGGPVLFGPAVPFRSLSSETLAG